MRIEIPGELPDLNQIIELAKTHWTQYREIKKTNTELVTWIAKGRKRFEKIDLTITWYCKDRRKDKDNISTGIKFILDGLVDAGIIKNDGWNHVNSFKHDFEVDKDNPRVEVEIREAD